MSVTASTGTESTTMTLETREESPAHFLLKIEFFSLLQCHGIEKYETEEFVAGEFKWKLIIYPNGDEKGKDREHISVHLAIVDTSSLPASWEVNSVFSIFLFNHNSSKFHFSPGITRRFRGIKSQWGIPKFISKKIMLDPSNGYLVDDSCVFGAEVFIVKREAVTECLSLEKACIPYKHEFKISNFSKLGNIWNSEEFSTGGGHKWKILLYPRGYAERAGSHVSVYLQYLGSVEPTPPKKLRACYTICIKDQVGDEHKKRLTDKSWFYPSDNWVWGRATFIELATMNNPSKGFIVKDCCILNIEISVQAVVRGSPLSVKKEC